jgi:DNA-binding transcriptional MocR family regulator
MIDLTKANVAPMQAAKPGAFSLSDQELTRLLGGQGGGYAPLGLPVLRQAIADRYTGQGLPTFPEQVLITSGAQQAIYLLATLYVHRGDNVLIENPTYAGAIEAFRATGGRLVPIPISVEAHELRADLFESLVRQNLPQMVYVTPTCNNPTGRVMSKEERRILARVSAEYRLPMLEDNALADLVFDDCVPASVAAYSGEAPVISVDSLSKLFWSGLRVGWIRAPSAIIARLARLKAVADLGNSLVSQAIAVRLIEHADELRAARRRELFTRLEFLSHLLHEHLPDWTWTPPDGGPYLWLRLQCGDAQEFAQLALRYGVLITPGASMSVDGSHTSYLRLPFYMEPAVLQEGVYRLAAAWEAFARLPGSEHHLEKVIV